MLTRRCPRCGQRVRQRQNYCPSCGVALRDEAAPDPKRSGRRRLRRIQLAGQIIAGVVSGIVSGMLALILAFYFFTPRGQVSVAVITPTPFGEQTPKGPLNASALVPIADSTFLVVDDLTDDAFYELRFAPDGSKLGAMERRPIAGLAPGHVEDFEGATLVETGGQRFLVAVSSLEGSENENTEAGLVRVTFDGAGAMHGESMPGFRSWLLASYPELATAAGDLGALNVEGLAWDPDRGTLIFGIRHPTSAGKPLVLEARVKDWAGAWTTSNLERVGIVALAPGDAAAGGGAEKGILDLARLPGRRDYVVILGDSVGKAKHAALYVWDGGDQGRTRRVDEIVFHPEMKPEGIAFGTIGGRAAAVLVDDTGGYYVVHQDEFDARLASNGG